MADSNNGSHPPDNGRPITFKDFHPDYQRDILDLLADLRLLVQEAKADAADRANGETPMLINAKVIRIDGQPDAVADVSGDLVRLIRAESNALVLDQMHWFGPGVRYLIIVSPGPLAWQEKPYDH